MNVRVWNITDENDKKVGTLEIDVYGERHATLWVLSCDNELKAAIMYRGRPDSANSDEIIRAIKRLDE